MNDVESAAFAAIIAIVQTVLDHNKGNLSSADALAKIPAFQNQESTDMQAARDALDKKFPK